MSAIGSDKHNSLCAIRQAVWGIGIKPTQGAQPVVGSLIGDLSVADAHSSSRMIDGLADNRIWPYWGALTGVLVQPPATTAASAASAGLTRAASGD